MRNVIVTGGAGFIGSAVTRHLSLQLGWKVTVVDKVTYACNLSSIADVSCREGVHFIQADIADGVSIGQILKTVRPDAILHLAAETHVDRSISGSAEFITTNVIGTHVLLEATRGYLSSLEVAERTRFRFLHVSTDEVYGSLEPGKFFTEETNFDPRSPYSASKASSNHLVAAWHYTYGLPTLIINSSNNYGPYQFPEKLIPLTILNALEGKPVLLYGDGGHQRDWLHVDDHVRAILLVLEKGQIGKTYVVGGREPRTNNEVVERICDELDTLRPSIRPRRELIAYVADRPGHDRRYANDPTRLETEFGWRAIVTFESGIASTVQWYLDREDWWKPIRSGVYGGERLGDLSAVSGAASLKTTISLEVS